MYVSWSQKTLQYEVTYYPEYIVLQYIVQCYEYKYQVPGTFTASKWYKYQEWYADPIRFHQNDVIIISHILILQADALRKQNVPLNRTHDCFSRKIVLADYSVQNLVRKWRPVW